MRVWLDDIRHMPEDYDIWVMKASVLIELVKAGVVTHIGFDHDLAVEHYYHNDRDDNHGTGYDVARYIEEGAYHGTVKRMTWSCQSANPQGKKRIEQAMQNAERYWSERGE